MPSHRNKTETINLSLQELGLVVRFYLQSLECFANERADIWRTLKEGRQCSKEHCNGMIDYYSNVSGFLRERAANCINWDKHQLALNNALDAIEEGRKHNV
jgi:hypothetical protein